MAFVDRIKNRIDTVLNKQTASGAITPNEFNDIASQVQLELFREALDDVRQSRRWQTQRRGDMTIERSMSVMDAFLSREELVFAGAGVFDLPDDFAYELERGFQYNNQYIELVSTQSDFYRLSGNLCVTEATPIGVKNFNTVTVQPDTIEDGVFVMYYRTPKPIKWTYVEVNGVALFNESAADFQDFELPEFMGDEITVRMLQYMGVKIRDDFATSTMAQKEQISATAENSK